MAPSDHPLPADDADRDDSVPMSLAEEIAAEVRDGIDVSERYESLKRSDGDIARLQKLGMQELLDLARQENLGQVEGEKKQDLVFRILRERIKLNGLMFGEGTLEILPDGFGFLRSPDAHYLSCPDDIYVSPSQVRRFGLRNGMTVAGQIRPPKESERYFALLRVEAINGEDPGKLTTRKFFDDLTPLHPDTRIVLETTVEEISTRVVDLHPVTLAQNARTSGGGNITMVPMQAITVGPLQTWRAEKVSIWQAGMHDNPLGQRLTALMISRRIVDTAVPMSLLADHPHVQFNYYRGGLGTCAVEMH